MEEELAETRLWDNNEKELDYSKVRVTQLPTNKRVIAPKPLTGTGRNKELHLQFLKTRIMQETKAHLEKEYDKQGRPKETNITPEEVKGIKPAREIA